MVNKLPIPNPVSPTTTALPVVLLLSLEKETFWDEQYSSLVDAISSQAAVKRVTKAASAVAFLANNDPLSILVTDAALTRQDSKLDPIREALVKHVHNGGRAVLGTHFTCFAAPQDLNKWFRNAWDLPWESGDYHRTTFHFNPKACGGVLNKVNVLAEYSQKAVFLKNVARKARVYTPTSESRIESLVFSPDPVDVRQTAVAFQRIGEGLLGYVGDVNGEVGSQAVINAMCVHQA